MTTSPADLIQALDHNRRDILRQALGAHLRALQQQLKQAKSRMLEFAIYNLEADIKEVKAMLELM